MTGVESATPRVFTARGAAGLKALAFLAGGVLFFAALGWQFLHLIQTPARPGGNDNMMPGLIGGLSVIGVGLIARGLFLLRSTRRVVLDSEGVHLETYLSRQSVPWGEIDHLERDKKSSMLGTETHKVIRLVGKNGKPLASIDESIDNFEALASEVTVRSTAATGRVTFDVAEDEQQNLTREKKKLKFVTWVFGLFTIGMVAALIAGINEAMHVRRFATEAVTVDARITNRRMYNVTPHVEYSFTDAQGRTFTKDAMMFQGPAWDAIQDAQTVPVEYLRSDPSWNRLVRGEDPGPQFGGNFLWLLAAGLVMFGSLFIFTLLGFDLKMENGVNTLTRNGRVVKAWGQRR
ncbi:MAG TPA: DUF3592 domain-containing protein [Tepidisphaeraceae bacterium]